MRDTDGRAVEAGDRMRAERRAQKAEQRARNAKDVANSMDGMRAKDEAVMLGCLGFFFLGIILGPLAIMKARKAEKFYGPATFGKVLGWIDILVAIAWIMVFIGFLNGSGHLD